MREDTFWRDQSIRFTSSVSPCRAIPTLTGPPPGDSRQVTGGKKHSFFVNHQRRLFPHEVNSRGNHNTQRGCQNVPILNLDLAILGMTTSFSVIVVLRSLVTQTCGQRIWRSIIRNSLTFQIHLLFLFSRLCIDFCIYPDGAHTSLFSSSRGLTAMPQSKRPHVVPLPTFKCPQTVSIISM